MAAAKYLLTGGYVKYVLFSPVYQSPSGVINLLRRCSQDTTEKISTGYTPDKSSSSNVKKEEYKVPEYYEHNEFSFVDIQIAMSRYRLPQPSSKIRSTK